MKSFRVADLDRAFSGSVLERATLTVYTSLSAAEDVWRRAIDHCACFVFQTFEWNATWRDTVGRTERVSEYIVHIADENDRTLLLLPLAICEQRGLRVMQFLGGSLADYNAPLIDRQFACSVGASDMERLWQATLRLMPNVDAIWLTRMPKTIDGVRNPMTELARARHTEDAYAAMLPESFKEFTASRSTQFFAQIRRHRRRLEKRGSVDIIFPAESDQRVAVVRALAQQKSDWLRKHGFANAFERPATQEFYERLTTCQLQAGNILVACLRVGDQIAATLWGAVFGSRYYFLVPSYAEEWRNYSAGRILTASVLERCIVQGDIRVFDLTIGDEGYKQTWSDHSLPLHEYLHARSAKGSVFVAYRRLRHVVRSNPRIKAVARAILTRLRILVQGGSVRKPADASS
jgi:CelD/BcsL family acetyltransferase involved in cellulose biosynthesis